MEDVISHEADSRAAGFDEMSADGECSHEQSPDFVANNANDVVKDGDDKESVQKITEDAEMTAEGVVQGISARAEEDSVSDCHEYFVFVKPTRFFPRLRKYTAQFLVLCALRSCLSRHTSCFGRKVESILKVWSPYFG